MDEVSLLEVLDAREIRAAIQSDLIARYQCTLICFTINMPGPVKYNDVSLFIHSQGVKAIHDFTNTAGIICKHEQIVKKNTGIEGYFLFDFPSIEMKKETCEIEDHHPLGRLFDMDVFDSGNKPISRDQIGLPRRKCLLCGKEGVYCSRNQTHSVFELQLRIKEMIAKAGGGILE